MFTRRAGEGLDLDPDVVLYMGRAAQGMPQDEGMDQRIADGFTRAVLKALEYVPERDGGELRTLEIRNEPKRMTPGEVREFFGGMAPGLGLDMGPYGRIVADQKSRMDSGMTPGFGDMNEYGLPRDMSPEDQAEVMKRYPF
tara:strand:- start:12279 stop:12701 length:423 start_codon:yes stop_codon:yes gene_type:complete